MLIAIALGLMILDQFGGLRLIQQVFSTVLLPIQQGTHQLGENLASYGAFTKNLDELRAENQDLREKYQEALANQGKVAALAQENAELQRQLDFKKNPDSKRLTTISAEVINRDSTSQNQAVIINRGSNDSLTVGLPVVDPSGYLVGRVSKVDPQRSTVLLITDTTIGVNVSTRRFVNDKQVDIPGGAVDGTALGQWQVGGRVTITLIKSEADIKNGDWVFTNGIGGTYPQNLLVGRVEEVIAQDGQPEKKATLKPIADLDHLQRVQVVTTWGDLPLAK
ncbi:MAG: rod shape-determining protein MreC [Chloroflexota bacterium]|nr:rod shape-determining protein MreC [Chloroflexota bacterium]